jgi:hypothetical protein
MELMSVLRSTKFLAGSLLAICCSQTPVAAQEVVLFLNAKQDRPAPPRDQELRSCLLKLPDAKPDAACPDVPLELFLRQGQRTELRVYNRKFLTDYSITVDAVTPIQSLPNIRNLDEAENLTLGPPSLAGPPPAKGGGEGLTIRTAAQILYELLDEGTTTKPTSDLQSDKAILDRERDRIRLEIKAFNESFRILRGAKNTQVACSGVLGQPDGHGLYVCMTAELTRLKAAPDWVAAPYSNEQEFRNAVTRVQDLIAAVKTFGNLLANSDVMSRSQKIETDVAQEENDLLVFQANIKAAQDAVTLADQMAENAGFRKALRREQLKAFLSKKLGAAPGQAPGQPPPASPQDEASMNDLLDRYERSSKGSLDIVKQGWNTLGKIATSYDHLNLTPDDFRPDLETIRTDLGIDLPRVIGDVNTAQGKLLARANEIYDRSEVGQPLAKQINFSGHSGNLIVYYTIRRIETFNRFSVAPVTQAGVPPGSQTPPSKGAPPATDGQTGSTSGGDTSASSNQPKSDALPGVVVSSGSFEVHDFFHANVVAAFAISGLKDQSIAKQPTPQGCGGTKANPDNNCFTPILNGGNRQQQVIIGLDYYLQPRDTYPRTKYAGNWKKEWVCAHHPLQCLGPMGAISVNRGSNFFLGGFFEPVLGVQIAGGANFGSETTLQRNFQFGTPADITGDFPTYEKRTTGWFVTAGLDLGIFRKIFGKVTGIGTSATGTQGK